MLDVMNMQMMRLRTTGPHAMLITLKGINSRFNRPLHRFWPYSKFAANINRFAVDRFVYQKTAVTGYASRGR